ncbi:MAG: hypothetical protein HPY85_15850 [Anaerolineae bacterium]|nr:hypothetical protein [Anaerolineae bacterium]
MSEQMLDPEQDQSIPEEQPAPEESAPPAQFTAEPAPRVEADAEREQPGKKAYRRPTSGIVWGFLLIALGAYFLLREFGVIETGFNWWAVFILLPAFGFFSGAWEIFWRKRRLTHGVRSSFGSGVVVLTVALILLLDLSWRTWWPLMVITPGLSIFLNGFIDRGSKKGVAERHWTMWNLWVGLSAMLLGATFLAEKLGLLSIREFIPSANWWAVFVALPGLGALVHAAAIGLSKGRHRGASLSLAVIGIAALAVAGVAYFTLNWNLILPIALIGGGAAFVMDTFVRTVFFKDNLH